MATKRALMGMPREPTASDDEEELSNREERP